MGTIISFNKASKKAAKLKKANQADQNRAKFGRAKSELTLVKKESNVIQHLLDDHKLDQPDEKGES